MWPVIVSSVCHEIEEHMRETGDMSAADRNWLDTTWRAVRERIRTILGDRTTQAHGGREDRVPERAAAGAKARGSQRHLARAGGLGAGPGASPPGTPGRRRPHLAARLTKPMPEVVCDAHRLRTDNAQWASFWSGCVHLVRNAIDHGVESAEVRRPPANPRRAALC